jgi:hypothetical protein
MKQWMLNEIASRLTVLEARMKCYNNQKDPTGKELKYKTAAQYRTFTKQDINMCLLLTELLDATTFNSLTLSDEAQKAFDRFIEPVERHTRR